jgi:hypothetical protein
MNNLRLRPAILASLALLVVTTPADGQGGEPQPAARQGVQRAIDRHAVARHEMSLAADRDRQLRDAAVAPVATIELKPGDMLTATTVKRATLRITIAGNKARVKRATLDTDFIPRGVTVDNNSGAVAIAAVSQVLIYDPSGGLVEVLTEPEGPGSAFGFVNAVLFDRAGLLIIADQGAVVGEREPADGRLWSYDRATGQFTRLASKRAFSDPKLLAVDTKGRILVVDGNSGPLVTPLLDVRYDLVYRLTGRKRKGARPIFREPGLQATAFAVHPDETMWFGSFDELVIADGSVLTRPCPVPSPLAFVTGLAVNAEGVAFALDGANVVTTKRFLYEIDSSCSVSRKVSGRRVAESRGLAVYEPTDG